MRGYYGVLVYVWFILHGSCCLGRFVVEKNYLMVTSPPLLKDVYECAIGNFGVPQYGGTMVGSVSYPKSNQKACRMFKDSDVSLSNKPGGIPVFLLVDRGGKMGFLFHDVACLSFPCQAPGPGPCKPERWGPEKVLSTEEMCFGTTISL